MPLLPFIAGLLFLDVMFRPLVLVCTFLLSLLIGYIYSLERCKPTTVNLNTETGKSGAHPLDLCASPHISAFTSQSIPS